MPRTCSSYGPIENTAQLFQATWEAILTEGSEKTPTYGRVFLDWKYEQTASARTLRELCVTTTDVPPEVALMPHLTPIDRGRWILIMVDIGVIGPAESENGRVYSPPRAELDFAINISDVITSTETAHRQFSPPWNSRSVGGAITRTGWIQRVKF